VCGRRQVRDVLKGALKPTCLSDTESELAGYSWLNASALATAVKRQFSEGSAHRSVVAEPASVVVTVMVVKENESKVFTPCFRKKNIHSYYWL